jgi:hypothetical protein
MTVGVVPERTKVYAAAKPGVEKNKTKMQSRARVFMALDMLGNY